MNSTRFRLGSVSYGTLRTADLIDSCMWELRRLDPDEAARIRSADPVASAEIEAVGTEEWTEAHPEDAGYLLDDIQESLENIAPAFVYFGSHPGDGSDFGFWVDWDAVDEARRFGELPSGDELPAGPLGDSWEFLVVSDHGNAELYAWDGGAWRAVWAAV